MKDPYIVFILCLTLITLTFFFTDCTKSCDMSGNTVAKGMTEAGYHWDQRNGWVK